MGTLLNREDRGAAAADDDDDDQEDTLLSPSTEAAAADIWGGAGDAEEDEEEDGAACVLMRLAVRGSIISPVNGCFMKNPSPSFSADECVEDEDVDEDGGGVLGWATVGRLAGRFGW